MFARTASLPEVDHDPIVRLHDLSWSQYLALREMRGERATPRIAYASGEIELRSPGRNHEALKKRIARLLEAWADEMGVDLQAYGSWTLEREEAERAVEPDECYVLGDGDASVPDLALEVVWSSGGFDKLALYAPLGVREVWTWRAGTLAVHVLRDVAYVRASRSALFPSLDLDAMLAFVEEPNQSAAVRAWRALLRRAQSVSPLNG